MIRSLTLSLLLLLGAVSTGHAAIIIIKAKPVSMPLEGGAQDGASQPGTAPGVVGGTPNRAPAPPTPPPTVRIEDLGGMINPETGDEGDGDETGAPGDPSPAVMPVLGVGHHALTADEDLEAEDEYPGEGGCGGTEPSDMAPVGMLAMVAGLGLRRRRRS